MDVIKSSGEKEVFNKDKLCESLRRSGAPEEMATRICQLVSTKVEPDITTKKIWRIALGHLIKEDLQIGARYSLRQALTDLGPAGFLFEQYFEALLQAYGFETERNVIARGISGVEHEIDIVAKRGEQHAYIEAKYHNKGGVKTSVEVVMYAQARLEDLSTAEVSAEKAAGEEKSHHEMWVVTNTKFTRNAIRYGDYKKIVMVGWDHPRRGGLEDMIIAKKMWPITVLPSLSNIELERFAEKGLIVVRDLLPYGEQDIVQGFDIPPEIARQLLDEAYQLVESG